MFSYKLDACTISKGVRGIFYVILYKYILFLLIEKFADFRRIAVKRMKQCGT